MNKYKMMGRLIPIIYPKFYTVEEKNGNELIFLDVGQDKQEIIEVSDKTQCEALENHFHLFEKVGIYNKKTVITIGEIISKNLLNELAKTFPNKKFIIYLDVNILDSVIIRFHQVWDNEPLYYDTTHFQNKHHQIQSFSN